MTDTKANRMRPFVGRTGAGLLVIAAVVVGVLISTALASKGHARAHRVAHKTNLSVFVTQHKVARAAAGNSLTPPAGAILAAVEGKTEIYVSQKGTEDCVIHLTPGEGGGSTCAFASKVEADGEVGVGGGPISASGALSTLRVSALVPDGVKSLHFVDRDGSAYDVPVTNNVVEHEDLSVAKVSYTLPDGENHVTNVAGMVDGLPQQPGPPGSTTTG